MRAAVLALVLLSGCAGGKNAVSWSCKAACFLCNTACPLVRDAMESAGGEEPTPEPTPPPDVGP